MHDVLVGHVGIGKNQVVHVVLSDKLFQTRFGKDGDAICVIRSRQFWGIASTRDVRDLSRGETYYTKILVVPIEYVEVVKISPGRPGDKKSLWILRDHGFVTPLLDVLAENCDGSAYPT
jgi:hypothetical protein